MDIGIIWSVVMPVDTCLSLLYNSFMNGRQKLLNLLVMMIWMKLCYWTLIDAS